MCGICGISETDYLLRTGAQAMSSDLDMDDHSVKGISTLCGYSDTSFFALQGGVSASSCPSINMYGKDATGMYGGHIWMEVPNAAKNASVMALDIHAVSDTPIVEILYGLDMNAKSIDGIGKLILNDATELTIATGAVTATQSHHTIDTESDAATDDLETINGGTAGKVLIVTAADSARTVVAKDGTGNLRLAGDFSMANAGDTLTLMYDGSNWLEISRSNNGALRNIMHLNHITTKNAAHSASMGFVRAALCAFVLLNSEVCR